MQLSKTGQSDTHIQGGIHYVSRLFYCPYRVCIVKGGGICVFVIK